MRKVVPPKSFKPFTPDVVSAMEKAFDEAWTTVEADEHGNLTRAETRELLALRIIEMAQRGEADKDRLRDDALAHFAREKSVAKSRARSATKASDPTPKIG